MDDIGARLTTVMLECYSIMQEIEAQKSNDRDFGNIGKRLAAGLPDDGRAVAISAYEEIIPNLRMGFEGGTGVKIEARQVAGMALPGGSAPSADVEITVADIGTSRWLTIEYVWSWAELVAKGSTHVLFEAAASQPGNIRPVLRLMTADGSRHDVAAEPFAVARTHRLRMASMMLPEPGITFDYNERPMIVLFLGLMPAVMNISRFFVW